MADTPEPIRKLPRRTELVVPAPLEGRVIFPRDARYAAARLVDNAAIDRRPAAIVMARGIEDILATLALVQATGTALAVRSGGHSTRGHGVAEDALVLDVSGMRGIEIDAASETAWIAAGESAGDATATLHRAGFAIPFGDSGSVGVSGLTLGGGIGWLVRRHGLTIDNLVAAELITAGGDQLSASPLENPDLFWALRGGGGNFGVATRLRFSLHRMQAVLAGRVILLATPAVLRRLIGVLFGAPDALTVIAGLFPAPSRPPYPDAWHGRLIVSLRFAHSGAVGDDPKVLELLRSIGPGVDDSVGRKPYPALFSPPSVARVATAVRNLFVDDLDERAIEIVERRMAAPSSPEALVQLRILGGAAARIANDETAFGHRDRRAIATLITPYEVLTETARHEAWTADFEAELLEAGCGSGAYVNFLGSDDEAALRAAYPPATLARLADVKRRHDPGNLFRSNLNVRPDLADPSG
jgi:FAD/FMN-containing dehydrogenase